MKFGKKRYFRKLKQKDSSAGYSLEMRALQERFSVDSRIMRVVVASSNPIETMHKINSGGYSIRTLLDTLEILDAKATVEEYEVNKTKQQNS